MKIFRHWATRAVEIHGKTFRLRDGSNVSPEDAAARLKRREEILDKFSGRLSAAETAAVREALLDLGGRTGDGGYEAAIVEEVVVELSSRDIVTRNRHGVEVLNSEDTCFIDVDHVRKPRARALATRLARLAPSAALVLAVVALYAIRLHTRRIGADIPLVANSACGVALALAAIFAFSWLVHALSTPVYEKPGRAEATLLAKARALAASRAWRGLAARVYRTAAGFRVLAQTDGLTPGGSRFRALARALDADPRYVALCAKQGCWRARLSPKPERVGCRRPPRETRFPRPPEADPAFAAWLADYSAACAGHAVCRPLETIGRFHETPAVRLHDESACRNHSVPLA